MSQQRSPSTLAGNVYVCDNVYRCQSLVFFRIFLTSHVTSPLYSTCLTDLRIRIHTFTIDKMPSCVLGDKCTFPALEIRAGHICPQCRGPVHVLFGIEDPKAPPAYKRNML